VTWPRVSPDGISAVFRQCMTKDEKPGVWKAQTPAYLGALCASLPLQNKLRDVKLRDVKLRDGN